MGDVKISYNDEGGVATDFRPATEKHDVSREPKTRRKNAREAGLLKGTVFLLNVRPIQGTMCLPRAQ